MRNIKKLLALMLVMVMALGMVPMVATASDNEFTDADDIEFVEAADVLKALDVIAGYPDGSFQPRQSVTRAEAMAYIVRSLLTPAVANRLPSGSSSFTDVLSNPSAAWASGIIEYAVSQGIALGRGEGLFDPQAPVTGIEMAAFWLRALGLGAYNDPATWAIHAVADGTRHGILTISDDVDLSAPATREQVALYTFNSLRVDEEDVKVGTAFEIDAYGETADVTALNGLQFATFLEAYTVASDIAGSVYVNPNTTMSTDGQFTVREVDIMETRGGLMEKVFNTTRVTGVPDNFGRPGVRTWMRGGQSVASSYTMDPVLTYTASVTQARLYADLGLRSNTPIPTARHFVNGKLESATAQISGTNTGATYGGNGVLTEVFRTEAGAITIVEVETFVGVIGQVTAPTAVAGETVTITPSATVPGTFAGSAARFATAGLKVNDRVIYTASFNAGDGDYTVRSVALADKLTLTASTFTATSFVADGTTYLYSENAPDGDKILPGYAFTPVEVYLDSFGYVIFVEAPAAIPNYAYVIRTGTTTNSFSEPVHSAELLLADGERLTVITEDLYQKTGSGALTAIDDTTDVRRLVTYRAVTGGRHELTPVSGATNPTDDLTLTRGVSGFSWGSTRYGNANTIYIVRTGTSPNFRYAVYQGFTDVPSISGTGVDGLVGVVSGMAAVVYVEATGHTIGATRDVVFVSRTWNEQTTAPNGVTYYLANVMVNGEREDLWLNAVGNVGLYTEMSINNNVTTLGPGSRDILSNQSLWYDGSVVRLGSASHVPASGLLVYTYDTSNGNISEPFGVAGLSTVVGNTETFAFQTNNTGQVTHIFIDRTVTLPTFVVSWVNEIEGATVTSLTPAPTSPTFAGNEVEFTVGIGDSYSGWTTGNGGTRLSMTLLLSNGSTITVQSDETNTTLDGSGVGEVIFTFRMPSRNITSITFNGKFVTP